MWFLAVVGSTVNVVPSPQRAWASTSISSMPTKRIIPGTAYVGDCLYTVGGTVSEEDYGSSSGAFEAYNLTSKTWSKQTDPGTDPGPAGLPGLPTPRSNLAVAAVGGVIYAVGGRIVQTSYFPTTSDSFEAFNTTPGFLGEGTGTWTKVCNAGNPLPKNSLPCLPTARFSAAIEVVDSIIYVLGGYTEDGTGDPIVTGTNPMGSQ